MPVYMITFLALIFSISFNSIANDETAETIPSVKLIADEWCPYTCKDTLQDKGLIVEVAAAAFKEVGMDVTYKSSSWGRAIREVKKGRSDALLGADVVHRQDLYLTKEFLIPDEAAFVVFSDSDATLDKPSDLHNYKLGLMADYSYGSDSEWQSRIDQHTNTIELSGAYGETRLLELLATKRIDVAVMNIAVAKYYLKNKHKFPRVKYIRKDLTSDLHIGFSPTERGKALRLQFLEGYQRIKKSDKLKAIYEKYGVDLPS